MAGKITLTRTCFACPEQYDAFYGPNRIGYLRLRHGNFTVECPWVSGELVYEASPKGDGMFDVDEREYYLSIAKQKIMEWYRRNQKQQNK